MQKHHLLLYVYNADNDYPLLGYHTAYEAKSKAVT